MEGGQIFNNKGEQHEYPLYCPFQCSNKCTQNSIFLDKGIATLLGIITIFISLWHIGKHLKYFRIPYFQAKIIIIQFMAPFYSISSILSIYKPSIAPYIIVFRDIYEALLLFTFFYLIFNYLAYDKITGITKQEQVYEQMIIPENGEKTKTISSNFPFDHCYKPYVLECPRQAQNLVIKCKQFILQCFIVKPVAAVIIAIATYYKSMTTIVLTKAVVFVSVCYSFYYLIIFYRVTKHQLQPYKPLKKFLVIKITLFFTFWQEITLKVLEHQVLSCFEHDENEEKKIMVGIENSLVCIEMLIMSILGGFAFTFHEFKPGGVQRGKFIDAIKDMFKTFQDDRQLIQYVPFRPKPEEDKLSHMGNLKIRESQIPEVTVHKQTKKFSYNTEAELSPKRGLTQYLIPDYN